MNERAASSQGAIVERRLLFELCLFGCFELWSESRSRVALVPAWAGVAALLPEALQSLELEVTAVNS